jgi:hypothetical protein
MAGTSKRVIQPAHKALAQSAAAMEERVIASGRLEVLPITTTTI